MPLEVHSAKDAMAPDTSMSQDSHQEDLVSHAFVSRVLALPALKDALGLAANVYGATKAKQYVGVAVKAAEAGVWAAASSTLPLATPFVARVGGWEAVDEWACRGLDRVEKAAPIITKPTSEIMKRTRELMLKTVAGNKVSSTPPSLLDAVSTRAHSTVDRVSGTRTGRVVVGVFDCVLDHAHTIVDTCLPPSEGDLHDTDGRDGGVTLKATALASKTQQRLTRSAHQLIYRTSGESNGEVVNSPAVLSDYEQEMVFGFDHNDTTENNGILYNTVVGGVNVVRLFAGMGVAMGVVVVEGSVKAASNVIYKGIHTTHAVAKCGKDFTQATVSNAMGLAHQVILTPIGVANKVITSGVGVANTTVSNTLRIGYAFVAYGVDTANGAVSSGFATMGNVLSQSMSTARTAAVKGAGAVSSLVTNSKRVGQAFVSLGKKRSEPVYQIYEDISQRMVSVMPTPLVHLLFQTYVHIIAQYTHFHDHYALRYKQIACNYASAIMEYTSRLPSKIWMWIAAVTQVATETQVSVAARMKETSTSYRRRIGTILTLKGDDNNSIKFLVSTVSM